MNQTRERLAALLTTALIAECFEYGADGDLPHYWEVKESSVRDMADYLLSRGVSLSSGAEERAALEAIVAEYRPPAILGDGPRAAADYWFARAMHMAELAKAALSAGPLEPNKEKA